MGAATALALALLEPGATVAVAQDADHGTGVLFRELERWGIRHVLFDQTGPPPADVQLVWTEAPSNPLMTMPDLPAAVAHAAPVVCDSTAATPIHLRPLAHGCDFVLHSATKYLAGHHDALLGGVVCRRPEDAARLHEVRTRTGIVAAPDAAWLLLRGLKTLDVRVERQTDIRPGARRQAGRAPRRRGRPLPRLRRPLPFDVADGTAAHAVETGHAA